MSFRNGAGTTLQLYLQAKAWDWRFTKATSKLAAAVWFSFANFLCGGAIKANKEGVSTTVLSVKGWKPYPSPWRNYMVAGNGTWGEVRPFWCHSVTNDIEAGTTSSCTKTTAVATGKLQKRHSGVLKLTRRSH